MIDWSKIAMKALDPLVEGVISWGIEPIYIGGRATVLVVVRVNFQYVHVCIEWTH